MFAEFDATSSIAILESNVGSVVASWNKLFLIANGSGSFFNKILLIVRFTRALSLIWFTFVG